MKKIFNEMLSNGVIDKKKLLIENYKKLNLTEKHVILLYKIIDIHIEKKITINILVRRTDFSKKEIEGLISDFVDSKFVTLIYKNNELEFKLNKLWDRLFSLYFPPNIDSTLDEKTNWILNSLGVIETKLIKTNIKLWIEINNDWEKLESLVKSFENLKMKKIEWILLRKYMKSTKILIQ